MDGARALLAFVLIGVTFATTKNQLICPGPNNDGIIAGAELVAGVSPLINRPFHLCGPAGTSPSFDCFCTDLLGVRCVAQDAESRELHRMYPSGEEYCRMNCRCVGTGNHKDDYDQLSSLFIEFKVWKPFIMEEINKQRRQRSRPIDENGCNRASTSKDAYQETTFQRNKYLFPNECSISGSRRRCRGASCGYGEGFGGRAESLVPPLQASLYP